MTTCHRTPVVGSLPYHAELEGRARFLLVDLHYYAGQHFLFGRRARLKVHTDDDARLVADLQTHKLVMNVGLAPTMEALLIVSAYWLYPGTPHACNHCP